MSVKMEVEEDGVIVEIDGCLGDTATVPLCVICNGLCIISRSEKESSFVEGVSRGKRKNVKQRKIVESARSSSPRSWAEYSTGFGDKLTQFQEDLREILGETGDKIRKRSAGKRKVLAIEASLKSEGMRVCSKCEGLLRVAMESKADMDEMEGHVRHLQGAILTALRMLDKRREMFLRDMQIIEELIQCSGGSGVPWEPPGAKRKRQDNNASARGKGRDDLSGSRFREIILKALSSLRQYQAVQTNKSMENPTDKDVTLPPPSKPLDISLPRNSSGVSTVDDGITSSIKLNQSQMNTNSSQVPVIGLKLDIDEDPDFEDDDDSLAYQDDSNDKDYTEEKKPQKPEDILRYQTSRRSSIKKAQKRLSAPPFPRDLSFLKANPRAYLSGRQGPAFDDFLSKMSPFKATIVMRTFNKKKRRARPGNKSPLNSHYVTYNPDTDTLSVDNAIPIKINEDAKTLECSVCSLQITKPFKDSCHWNIEKKMMYHILGKHMNAFRCADCDETFPVYTAYFLHIQMHSNGNPTCEVCGKRLPSQLRLEEHKWVHMTPEQKEQAKKEGKVDPNDKSRNLPRVHQCDLCGKSFKKPYELRLHTSRKHEAKPEMSFMCTGCGKIFKAQRNLTVHQRQKCVALEKQEVEEELVTEVVIDNILIY